LGFACTQPLRMPRGQERRFVVAEISFRKAEPAEADAIAGLINRAFAVERFFVDGDRTSPQKVRELFGTGSFLVAEDGDGLVGCVYVERRGERGYVGLLSIDPTRQRSGLGSRLMAAAEDHARKAGCQAVDLRVVNLRQELPGFYHRLGYTETGAEPFPPDAKPKLPCHLVTMSKLLA
jgi:predicted N-acetyltransferase YhbS